MNHVLTFIAAMHLRFLDVSERVENRSDSDRGATATEYAMLVAFIAIAIAGAVTAFGTNLSTFFSGLSTKIGIK